MIIDLTKEHLMDLIVGGITPPFGGGMYCTFSGNQHIESWVWNRIELSRLTEQELVDIYNKRKNITKPILKEI